MLKRKIEDDIKLWLNNSSKALLVEGARQVGKTFIIKKVLKDSKVSFYEFNFIENPELVRLFSDNKSNTADFIKSKNMITKIEKINF